MDERERGLAAALDQIRGVDIDEAAARAHVMRPGHLRGVASDRGREGVPVKRLFWPPVPVLHRFDANGFIRALEDGSGHREQGVAFFLPLNMELVVLVNSPVGEGPAGQFLYTVVSDAYAAHLEEVLVPPVASASPA